MTDTERSANQFVSHARAQWEWLVKIAWDSQDRKQTANVLSQAAGVGKSNLQRKLEAIAAAKKDGLTEAAVMSMGQRRVMEKYVKDKNNGRQDEQVVLKWLVAPEIRDDVQEQFWRIGKLLKMTTSNEVWSFVLAQLSGATDEDILHSAGDIR